MTLSAAGRLFSPLLLGIALSSCRSTNAARVPEPAADGISLVTVPVVKVSRADLSNSVKLTAEFLPYQEVDVLAKVSGYVRKIQVDIGDRVKEGQLLATLESPEMAADLTKASAVIDQTRDEVSSAQDAVRQAESNHGIAHVSYQRLLDVAKKEPGLISQQEVDEVRSRDQVAEAQVAAAQSNLRAAEQRTRVARADETRVRTLIRYTEITAPFTGVVTKRYANTGVLIQAGVSSQTQSMPIVRLSQNNLLRLMLPVPESAVPRIHVGQSVEVHVSSLNRSFTGRVARFADKVEPSTRTMDTEVDVPNPGLTLVPGMYAEVNLELEQHDRILSLPLDAVEGSGPQARVYVVRPSGTIHITPVSLGIETANRVEIRSGVQDGESVIVGRHAGLTEGEKVQTTPAGFVPAADGKK